MKIKVYTPGKTETRELEVSSKVFGVEENKALLSQVVLTALSNSRRPIANTKNRGQVSGGGRKPFRQKGTGNARAGSTRSPLWIGGGVTFGPMSSRNFSKRLPQKMAQKALKMALSDKVKSKKLVVVSDFNLKSVSTKLLEKMLQDLPIEEGRILAVLPKTDVNMELSASNLQYIKVVQLSGMSTVDILGADYLVTNEEGIKQIESVFGKDAKVVKAEKEVKVAKTPKETEKK